MLDIEGGDHSERSSIGYIPGVSRDDHFHSVTVNLSSALGIFVRKNKIVTAAGSVVDHVFDIVRFGDETAMTILDVCDAKTFIYRSIVLPFPQGNILAVRADDGGHYLPIDGVRVDSALSRERGDGQCQGRADEGGAGGSWCTGSAVPARPP